MTKEAHFSSEFKETALFAPPSLLKRLAELEVSEGLTASTGAKSSDASLPRHLVNEIVKVSEAYTRERTDLRQASSSRGGLRARLRFFLPRDLPKAAKPLFEAAARGALPQRDRLRILDLGAGLGTTTLSLLRVLHLLGDERPIDVLAIDRDPAALKIYRELLSKPIEGFSEVTSVRVEEGDLALLRGPAGGPLLRPSERFDLVLIGLAINEFGRKGHEADLLALFMDSITGHLVEGGLVLIVEPALRKESRGLMKLRDLIAESDALEILGPCMHRMPCPLLLRERDWCHDSLSGEHPEPIRMLAAEAGLRDSRPTFSWLLLRKQPAGEQSTEALGSNSPQSAEILRGRLVSHRLASKGKLEVQLCATTGELITLRQLDRHRSSENAVFDEIARGDRIEARGERRNAALVLGKDGVVKRL